jgi:hypothetical protein
VFVVVGSRNGEPTLSIHVRIVVEPGLLAGVAQALPRGIERVAGPAKSDGADVRTTIAAVGRQHCRSGRFDQGADSLVPFTIHRHRGR